MKRFLLLIACLLMLGGCATRQNVIDKTVSPTIAFEQYDDLRARYDFLHNEFKENVFSEEEKMQLLSARSFALQIIADDAAKLAAGRLTYADLVVDLPRIEKSVNDLDTILSHHLYLYPEHVALIYDTTLKGTRRALAAVNVSMQQAEMQMDQQSMNALMSQFMGLIDVIKPMSAMLGGGSIIPILP